MIPSNPAHTFHSLPLTAEQDQEIRHYIRVRQRAGQAWDTEELRAMVADMLDPPETAEEAADAVAFSIDAESAAAARQWSQDQRQDGEPGPDAPDHAS
ncbi:hypothetical protein [Zemynaea arenosa]|uniref:hypothetical protein n=1 Tax=Zemynaea arenosa TaxID=2561931 RepID=UPI0015E17E59|nr:hypothetical protein [Massilia arenosa]